MKATARLQLVCGECGPCKRGQYNACQKLKVRGFQAPGVAQFALTRGASKVLITDVSDYRLNIVRQCGIGGTLHIKNNSFEDGVKSFFGNEGFQVGFEAAGVQASLDNLMQFVEKGGDIVILGVYSRNPVVNMFYLGEYELNVYGSMMYRHEDYEAAVEMICPGKIMTSPLLTGSFPFNRYLDAYKFIDEQGDRIMKVMIEM